MSRRSSKRSRTSSPTSTVQSAAGGGALNKLQNTRDSAYSGAITWGDFDNESRAFITDANDVDPNDAVSVKAAGDISITSTSRDAARDSMAPGWHSIPKSISSEKIDDDSEHRGRLCHLGGSGRRRTGKQKAYGGSVNLLFLESISEARVGKDARPWKRAAI